MIKQYIIFFLTYSQRDGNVLGTLTFSLVRVNFDMKISSQSDGTEIVPNELCTKQQQKTTQCFWILVFIVYAIRLRLIILKVLNM